MTATLIKHRVVKDTIAIVVTTSEQGFTASFQVYKIDKNGECGRHVYQSDWGDERQAIAIYENYLDSDFLYELEKSNPKSERQAGIEYRVYCHNKCGFGDN